MKKDTSKIIDLDSLFEQKNSKVDVNGVPPELAARIDLVEKFNVSQKHVDSMTSSEVLVEYAKHLNKPVVKKSIDIEAILSEWAWRCDKGYPDFNNTADKIKLQEVLDEMKIELPFKRITEAPVKTAHWKQVFSPENINRLYPKHGKEIMQIFKAYVPNPNKVSEDKLKVLNLFDTITTVSKLMVAISTNVDNPFFQALFNVSSVSGAAGGEDVKSGRGGLGKGEVLCVLLTKGGESGGVSGTDLAGTINAEIKSNDVKEFKIPLAAARVPRLNSQAALRKIYTWISDVNSLPEYQKFLTAVQNALPAGEKMKPQKDGTYFRGESVTDINQTEFNNLKLFFKGCNKYFSGKSDEKGDVYVDMDAQDGTDILMKAKLTTPKTIKSIKPDSVVSMKVMSKSEDAVKVFQQFEIKLKNHPFVKTTGAFESILKDDCLNLIKNPGFIIFLEPKKGKLGKPIFVNDNTYNPRLVGFTLNQAIIKYDL